MKSSQDQPTIAQRIDWRHVFALGVVAAVAHLPALKAGFVLDDRILLVDNPYVRSLSGLWILLRRELFVACAQPRFVPYYRPMAGFLNWLSYQLFGASAPWQHLFNLVLHVGVTVALYGALRCHRVRSPIALAAAAVLGVHPATSEVVAYLGGRQDLAGWLFLFGAMALHPRIRSYAGTALLAFGVTLLGGLCHEFFLASFLPLALLSFGERGRSARLRAVFAVAGGGGALVAVAALRRVLGILSFDLPDVSHQSLARASSAVLLRLLKDVLMPTDLAVDVTIALPHTGAAWLVVLAALAAGSALSWYVEVNTKAERGVAQCGMSLMALGALLHSGVVLKYGQLSDRYAYTMLVGVLCTVAGAVNGYTPGLSEQSRLARLTQRFGVPAMALCTLPLTWSRDASWFDETSLQMAMIAERPNDPESQLAAGMMYSSRGDLEQAYPHCLAYAKARPNSEKANLCVGTWLLLHNRADEAVTYLRTYALARPGVESARRAFLMALFATRNLPEAESTLEDWSKMFTGASDLVAAKAELERLRSQIVQSKRDATQTDR